MTVEEASERVTGAELRDWQMYEEIYGPIVTGDRVDIGLAQVGYVIARMGGSKSAEFRHFLPPWWRELAAEDSVRRFMERMIQMAKEGERADDLHVAGADGR